MQGRTGEDAEAMAITEQGRHQREQPGIEQHAEGAEQHHAGNRNRHLVIARPDHPGTGQDRRSATDRMTGADQYGGATLHAQHPGAQPDGQADGRENQQCIGDKRLYPQGLHLLHGQPEAIQRHAQAQHRLLAQLNTGRSRTVQRARHQVADRQSQQHGQGQRADPASVQ
ncbi:hypothetical protein D3C79_877150 [compost metagenome]